MSTKKYRVLLVVDQCNPQWTSVPLLGYRYYQELSQLAEVTLVTHQRNKKSLTALHPTADIVYIEETPFFREYYKVARRLSTFKGRLMWPLYNALAFPCYQEFNQSVYQQFGPQVRAGKYDIVHAITPMMPRYPFRLVEACEKTPFILGPVNGGVPYPKGLRKIALQEFAYFNVLRSVGRWLLPGYRNTYRKADYILAGSGYTLDLIQELFQRSEDGIELYFENGITQKFATAGVDGKPDIGGNNAGLESAELAHTPSASPDVPVHLLFVGRLVPYKGADMLVEAVSLLPDELRDRIHLTIAGTGPEEAALKEQVATLQLQDKIEMTGWIPYDDIHALYGAADVFCFPSVREFGGAVVMEAMACGLPCIVVNNGGIGEYVTEATGFKIEPTSREYIVQQLQQHIATLVNTPELGCEMARHAKERAKDFFWDVKAKKIIEVYDRVLSRSGPREQIDENTTTVGMVAEKSAVMSS
ncbi:MAG: glycosyltransferase family 4 protein [Cyanobacteria bacterium J06623_4]